MDLKKSEAGGVVYDDTASAYSVEQGPPAYHFKRSEAPSVKIARLVGGTIVLVTLLAGMFYLLGVYIDARTSCRHIAHNINKSPSSNFHPVESSRNAEALINSQESKPVPLRVAPPPSNVLTSHDDIHDDSSSEDGDDATFRFPLTLSMEDIGAMMHKQQRAQVNCLVEKKKSEEIVTENPKHFETPFGNLTTDPRYVHLSGEAVLMSCKSGHDHPVNQGPRNFPHPPMGIHPFANGPIAINHLMNGPAGINHLGHGPMVMNHPNGPIPSIHVMPMSASGRLMNGHGPLPPHPFMGHPMPFHMPSVSDMMPPPEMSHGPAMSRDGIPLPMMPPHHPDFPANHEDDDGPMPIMMPMHMGMFPDLQPRSAEMEDEDHDHRKKRSLAACSCTCR